MMRNGRSYEGVNRPIREMDLLAKGYLVEQARKEGVTRWRKRRERKSTIVQLCMFGRV